MNNKYKFKEGHPIPKGISPTDAGKAIEQLISKHGEARPEHLVDAARSKKHPLHHCFEWDDSKAAHEHRLNQARYVLRAVMIVREDRPEVTLRAFVNIERAGGWKAIGTVLSEPSSRTLLLQQALSDLRAFERKYATLSELDEVRKAIGSLIASATKRAA
jgi:hypothetical protein